MRHLNRGTVLAGIVATIAGAAIFLIASTVFAYHSANHDEGVYLFQAAMLLEGQLEIHTGDLTGAFRPWFFVEDSGRLYPRYSPVPAAMYAISMALFDEPRVTLAVIGGANVFLVYLLASTVFDRRVGVVASILFAASPLALVSTAVFFPYAPTTVLNLCFAVAYVRYLDGGSYPAAVTAGIAIGLAFFARPFTAVLFAMPFVLYALYRVLVALRNRERNPVLGHTLIAGIGLLFVAITLAYNHLLTGSALTFPYQAFAPHDGPGFGTRRLLGHAVEYTPSLALEANLAVLWTFASRWFTAGLIGVAFAGLGLAVALSRRESATDRRRPGSLILAGLFVTIPAGNLLFWGNLNILGSISDPTDGMIATFGPFYHFDLLVPLAVFAAVGVMDGWDRLSPWLTNIQQGQLTTPATVGVLGVLVVTGLLVGVLTAGAVATPLERNLADRDHHEAAYAPIDEDALDDGLVFIPTPYGTWQHHPFQSLRNDPGFDGPVVYALDRAVAGDFAVIDAYPDRDRYRYTYRGEWSPASDPVTATVEPLDHVQSQRITGETVVGVPPRVDHAMVRLAVPGESPDEFVVDDPDGSIAVNWTIDDAGARLEGGQNATPRRLDDHEAVALTVTLVQPDGSTLTYRLEMDVRHAGETVEVLWPPERFVCPLVTDCGTEGTYLPDHPDAHREGVWMETDLESENP